LNAPDESDRNSGKLFVLDTNVLLHNPAALFMFDDNTVVIPFVVLEELDKFKSQNDDVGRNAREVIRHLDRLRTAGNLGKGVTWNGHGGTIRIELSSPDRPAALIADEPDNRIISVALAQQHQGHRTILISKDLNVRIKSDALGLHTEDFEAQKVDADRLYSGYVSVTVPGDVINSLYNEKQIPLETLQPHLKVEGESGEALATDLFANQYVQLRDAMDESYTGLVRRLAETDHVITVHGPRKPIYGIMARNVQQTMAFDLLLDDEVKLVTLLGTAGTGKTLLAVAAGMAKTVTEDRYDKLLVARPIMPMGRDIGYLSGRQGRKALCLDAADLRQPHLSAVHARRRVAACRKPVGRATNQPAAQQRAARARTAHVHSRPQYPPAVHHRCRSTEPHAARGQDHCFAGG